MSEHILEFSERRQIALESEANEADVYIDSLLQKREAGMDEGQKRQEREKWLKNSHIVVPSLMFPDVFGFNKEHVIQDINLNAPDFGISNISVEEHFGERDFRNFLGIRLPEWFANQDIVSGIHEMQEGHRKNEDRKETLLQRFRSFTEKKILRKYIEDEGQRMEALFKLAHDEGAGYVIVHADRLLRYASYKSGVPQSQLQPNEAVQITVHDVSLLQNRYRGSNKGNVDFAIETIMTEPRKDQAIERTFLNDPTRLLKMIKSYEKVKLVFDLAHVGGNHLYDKTFDTPSESLRKIIEMGAVDKIAIVHLNDMIEKDGEPYDARQLGTGLLNEEIARCVKMLYSQDYRGALTLEFMPLNLEKGLRRVGRDTIARVVKQPLTGGGAEGDVARLKESVNFLRASLDIPLLKTELP